MYEVIPAENPFLAGTGYLKSSVPFFLLKLESVEREIQTNEGQTVTLIKLARRHGQVGAVLLFPDLSSSYWYS